MSKNLSKIAALLMALAMLALTACAPAAPVQQDPTAAPPAQNVTPDAGADVADAGYVPDFSKKLTISANTQNAEAIPGTALWDTFQQQFNVDYRAAAQETPVQALTDRTVDNTAIAR